MLNNIKSKYILAEVFDLLAIKHQLRLIVHNKVLQNKLNINKETYKHHCGRYIELEGDYGKEYLVEENILLYEGQYKHLSREGKGKEYYKNKKIKFEGEYLKGKRWNGELYNIAGVKEFEIIKGSGNIRDYNIYGVKIYEGDIVNGIKEGFVKNFLKEN